MKWLTFNRNSKSLSLLKEWNILTVVLTLFVHSGCGQTPIQTWSEIAKSSAKPASMPNIKFASNFSIQSRYIYENDLKILTSLSLDERHSADFQKVSGLKDTSPQSLVNWLEERFKYFLPNVNVSQQHASVKIPIYNLGALIYTSPNRTGNESVAASGIGNIPVDSPRRGIIQEGDGLLDLLMKEGSYDDVPHVIARLSFYFHESRHSDGNGDSLCFRHTACPAGHHLANLLACDEVENGSYGIGTYFLRGFLSSCKGCSAKTISLIQIMIADGLSRIRNPGKLANASPVGS